MSRIVVSESSEEDQDVYSNIDQSESDSIIELDKSIKQILKSKSPIDKRLMQIYKINKAKFKDEKLIDNLSFIANDNSLISDREFDREKT